MIALGAEFLAYFSHQSAFSCWVSSCPFPLPLSPFPLNIFEYLFFFSLCICHFLLSADLRAPFRETYNPRVQLQRSYSVWAPSIIGNEKVGYPIPISLHLPLLYAWLKTLILVGRLKRGSQALHTFWLLFTLWLCLLDIPCMSFC